VSTNALSLALTSVFSFPMYFSCVSKLVPSIGDFFSQLFATFLLIFVSLLYQMMYYVSLSIFIDEIEGIGGYNLLLFSLIVLYLITLVSIKAFYEAFLVLVHSLILV